MSNIKKMIKESGFASQRNLFLKSTFIWNSSVMKYTFIKEKLKNAINDKISLVTKINIKTSDMRVHQSI